MVVKHQAGCPIVSFKLIIFIMGFVLVLLAFLITKMPVSILYIFIGIIVQLFTFSILVGMYFKRQFDFNVADSEKDDETGMAGWTIAYLIFSFAFACCIGQVFKMLVGYVPLLLGVFLGFTSGSMLITVIDNGADALFNTTVDVFNSTTATIFLIIAVLIGFYVGLKLSLFAIILTQSFMAAYVFVRGVSCWFGGFPSESQWMEAVTGDGHVHLTWVFWVYLISIGAITVLGVKHQYSRGDHNDQEQEEENDQKK